MGKKSVDYRDYVGKFRITEELITANPKEFIKAIYLLKVIILRAEYLAHQRVFEYIGTSPLFEKLEPGEEPREYNIIVHT